MSVAIVDYGSGNLHSAAKAFERAARDSGHDQPIPVSYTHLRAHETVLDIVCRLLLEKKNHTKPKRTI